LQGYASREAALNILLEHEASGAFLKDLFPHFTEGLPKPDRGLVREIALGVIRNLSLLDYNIDLYAAKPPGPGVLRNILRLTAYQIFFLDVPDFAAVNVAVELAKRSESRHQGGFVNAVLKKLAAAGLQKVPGGSIKALAVNHSHPEWLLKRWYRRLGGDGMIKALERNNQEAPLFLRVNPAKAGEPPEGDESGLASGGATAGPSGISDPSRAASALSPGEAAVAGARAELERLGALTEPDAYAKPYLKLTSRGGAEIVLRSDLFRRGALAFQDPAAWFIAELADWKAGGETLLDLCSAPGGKAASMTERVDFLGGIATRIATGNATAIGTSSATAGGTRWPEAGLAVCNDISFRRLEKIGDAIGRLGHTNLLPVVMDPARPALRARFDLIVVDAPCSNLGVLRRRPEARWNHSPEHLERLARLQGSLLDQAAALAAPGGRIVYATCSPEEEETWNVVQAFLSRRPEWTLADAGGRLPAWAVKQGCLWLHPGETDYDGFFAARLERKIRP
jgi:16S rRNA (cytosine967-C5)-methyltransferase